MIRLQLMSCPTETDARRWSEALAPPAADAGETLYAGWDCPQVAALYAYAPTQPDELALAEGDIVNVTRKTSEGMDLHYGHTRLVPRSISIVRASFFFGFPNNENKYYSSVT